MTKTDAEALEKMAESNAYPHHDVWVYEAKALFRALASEKRAAVPVELRNVAEQLTEKSGFWRHCTGCLEMNEGHPVGHYPYSEVFKCQIGSGCSECGGIGAVWDNTDYEKMAKAMEPEAAVPVDAEREELAKWCLVPRDLEHALMEWVGAISTDDPKQWKIDIAFGRLRQGITGYIQAVADGRATQANATLLRTPAQAPAGWLLFPAAAWEFLSGVATLDGVSFGDRHPTRGGAFWWRSVIGEMIDAGPDQGGSNG